MPLLSDIGKEASTAYTSIYSDLLGLKGVGKRSAYVIDKKGNVAHAEVLENAGELPDLEKAISLLKSLA